MVGVEDAAWDPRVERPRTVVPVKADREGRGGPTPQQVRSGRWRRVARGFFVPADTPRTVEQRILEQSMRIPQGGAVSGWASLRWQGAAYFDGLRWGGGDLDVPILLGGAGANLRPAQGSFVWREQFPPGELVVVAGLPCSVAERALFDEVRRIGSPREGAVAIDMAAAAELTSVGRFASYVAGRCAWTGVPLVRKAVALAHDGSRSPQESRMRLVWVVDAGLPVPLCNVPVFDRAGRLLGVPDLLDPVAGVVGEYDGFDHLKKDRRQRDIVREQRLRDHGLEYFTVVRGDLQNRNAVARRMRAARSRAKFLPADRRAWSLSR